MTFGQTRTMLSGVTRRFGVGLVLWLVGCSGASAVIADGGSSEIPDGAGSDSGALADAEADSLSPADVGGETQDSSDGAVVTDAGNDADADEVTDADASTEPDASTPPDASEPDASQEQDASVPPPICKNGTFRCHEYRTEKCDENEWKWEVGVQDCCHAPTRFQVVGNEVKDLLTGRTWFKGMGRAGSPSSAESLCSALGGYRLPTTAELQEIMIGGPPINNKTVCSPAVDGDAFYNAYGGDNYTSDGCVDLDRFTTKVACTESTVGFLCIKP